MAIWKKVIVSGSSAELAALKVDNLTSGSVVIGGGSVANLSTTPINGTGNIVATTGATGLSASGSFSGSFTGTATTASYVLNAASASFATTSSFTFQAANAASASYALSSSYAMSASIAQNAVTASYVASAASLANALTFGVGLSGSVSSYNGSTAVTLHLSGAAALTTNVLTKWSGTGLVNTNITDTGTQIQIGAGASSGLSVAAGGLQVTGNSTFNNNLTVQGDLTVNGTASFVNSTNLYVKDQFILISSGSTTLQDSGIVAQYNAAGSGSAFFIEAGSAGTYGRWAMAYDITGASTAVTADEYVVSAKINQASNPSAAPTWGGTNGTGNLWVTNAGDIFIYA